MSRRRLAALVGLGSLYIGLLGVLSGMAVERIRFDVRRGAVLAQLETTEQRLHARLMDLERRTVQHARE